MVMVINMSDVMGITRLSHLCTVNMAIQYMQAVLGNHKTMTHQYTVNVIHVYRRLIVFAQHPPCLTPFAIKISRFYNVP